MKKKNLRWLQNNIMSLAQAYWFNFHVRNSELLNDLNERSTTLQKKKQREMRS